MNYATAKLLAKPGYQTSEFLLAIVLLLGAVLIIVYTHDATQRHIATTTAPILGTSYIASRHLLKAKLAKTQQPSAAANILSQIGAAIMTTLAPKATTATTTTTPSTSSSLLEGLLTTALSFLSSNSTVLSTEVADIVSKGLRAKYPTAAPTMEADIQAAATALTNSATAVVDTVTAIKAVIADF